MRKWLLLFILLCALASYYQVVQGHWHIPYRTVALLNQTLDHVSPQKSIALTPDGLRDSMRARYRLSPDRRLSGAVVLMAEWGGEHASDSPRFAQGHWEQPVAGMAVRYDELPTYTQARQAMTPLAQAILARIQTPEVQRIASDEPIRGLDPRVMQSELRLLDARWKKGDHSAQLLQRAAAATVRLLYVTFDEAEVADPLATQAVALMALVEAQGIKMPLEESMLAWRLGYDGDAISVAQALPEDHPWRLYLVRDDERLAAAIEKAPEFAYLLLERLAAKDQAERWAEAMRRYGMRDGEPDIHMLATGMNMSNMQIQEQIAFATPALTILSMYFDQPGPATERDLEQLRSNPSTEGMGDKESELRQVLLNRTLMESRKAITGPFLSPAVFDSYHRAFIESGMYVLAKINLDRRDDLYTTRIYTALLRTFDAEISQRMGAWLDHLVSSHEGHADQRALLADIGNPRLGIRLRRRTLDEWARYSPMESAQHMQAVDNIFRGLDSRIEHRYQMANLARSQLYHLELADRLYASIVESEPTKSGHLLPYLAYYNGDPDGLLAMAEDASLAQSERLSALEYLQDDPAVVNMYTRMNSVYETLIDAEPKAWGVRNDYIKLLEKEGNYPEVTKQAKEWLSIRDKDASEFYVWNALIAISDACLAAGDLNTAWDVVEPQIEGQYGGILRQAVKVRLAEGDMDKAEELAEFMHRRYPDYLPSLLPLVVVYWRKQDYAAAAKLLKSWNQPVSMTDWRFEIGRQLAEQVKDHNVDAEAAFKALIAAGIPVHELNQLVLALGKADPGRAAALSMQLQTPGLAQISLDLDTYSLLAEANGQEAADHWLRQRLGPVRQDAVAGIAIERHQFAVPWRVAEPNGPNEDAVWLYRAAVFAMGKEQSTENRQRLDDYYDHNSSSFYDQLGAMVLGKLDEDIIARQPMSNRQVSEAAYYLGLRAINEGRYADGCEWLRVSMETGEQSNGEYRWSLSHLVHWRDQMRNMKVLAAAGQLF